VREVLRERVARPVLVLGRGPGERPDEEVVAELRALGAELVEADDRALHARVVDLLLARRAARGLTREAAEPLARRPLWVADALVALGDVDGCVAGAAHTTAEVLRAALWLIGARRACAPCRAPSTWSCRRSAVPTARS
jgi:phosphate acetyltransferase